MLNPITAPEAVRRRWRVVWILADGSWLCSGCFDRPDEALAVPRPCEVATLGPVLVAIEAVCEVASSGQTWTERYFPGTGAAP